MLVLKMRQAEFPEGDAPRVERAVFELTDQFKPLLASAIAYQASELGLEVADLTPPTPDARNRPYSSGNDAVWAELFSQGPEIVALQVLGSDRRIRGNEVVQDPLLVRLYGMGPTGAESLMDELAAALGGKLGIEFRPWRYQSPRFDELQNEEGMQPSTAPPEEDRHAAELLSDSTYRTAAVAIASSGGLLVTDLPKQLPDDERGRADDIARELQEGGLVTSELLVTCRRTSTQVARAPSQDSISQASAQGLKCASCGRSVDEERVEEALALTERGRQMLDGSRWLSVLLATELAALGVDPDRMLIEQTAGGDESDCLADISGELVFFELKDKEFSLGNAYSFGSKIAVFRPVHSVVVTTAHVGNDAKEHFKKARRPKARGALASRTPGDIGDEITYIEGIESIRSGLRDLAEQIYSGDANTILSEVLTGASLNALQLVQALRQANVTVGDPRTAD